MLSHELSPSHPLDQNFLIQAGNIAQSLVNLNYTIGAAPEDPAVVRALSNQALLQACELGSLLRSANHE
jgi:hypothetical protein